MNKNVKQVVYVCQITVIVTWPLLRGLNKYKILIPKGILKDLKYILDPLKT